MNNDVILNEEESCDAEESRINFQKKMVRLIVDLGNTMQNLIFDCMQWLKEGLKNKLWDGQEKAYIKVLNIHMENIVRLLEDHAFVKNLILTENRDNIYDSAYTKDFAIDILKQRDLFLELVKEHFSFVIRYQETVLHKENMV